MNPIQFPHIIKDQVIEHSLYPSSIPNYDGMLQVSSIHSLYYAVYGNPEGIPVVVLHGGPGAGCYDAMTRFFDLSKYLVVMFDQRGAMRSTPLASMEDNNPQRLVEDIETIRKYLNIDRWLIFGGSWGSTLGLLYGQAHPERCLGFVLRGIFLAREFDDAHLVYGMGKTFPEAYHEFLDHIPADERNDLKQAYYQRIMNPDSAVHLPAARAFMKFDLICSTQFPDPNFVENQLKNDRAVLAITRTFFHYAINNFFLEPNQVIANMSKISHLPAILVHGRWDVITLPEMAYSLHQYWVNSTLWMVPMGGHSTTEPAIAMALATALDQFSLQLNHASINKKSR